MLFWKKESTDFRLEIWRMEDNGTSKRDNERLTARRILNHMLEKESSVEYDEHGKPHVNGCHISIAHTGEYVGVIMSEQRIVGMDLERIRQKNIVELAAKFMNMDELSQLYSSNAPREYFYAVWGAKEVLFKIHGRKGLLFTKNLLTANFSVLQESQFDAWIKKDSFEKKYIINYQFINDLLLTYAIDETNT